MLSPAECTRIVEESSLLIWRAALDKGCDYFNPSWCALISVCAGYRRVRGDGQLWHRLHRCFMGMLLARTHTIRPEWQTVLLRNGVPSIPPPGPLPGDSD